MKAITLLRSHKLPPSFYQRKNVCAIAKSLIGKVLGIHHLFNVVTNSEDIPHAVLIRSVEPLSGMDDMLVRTGKPKPNQTLTRGPGHISKALGIYTKHTGISLQSDELFVADDGYKVKSTQITATPRIGG